jgi:hypothetical protein
MVRDPPRAPLVAGVAISLADSGGPIEVAKESVASLRSATLPPSQEELLASVAWICRRWLSRKQNPRPIQPTAAGRKALGFRIPITSRLSDLHSVRGMPYNRHANPLSA